jgi:hypothetical protein
MSSAQRIAIIGTNGAGKATGAKLITFVPNLDTSLAAPGGSPASHDLYLPLKWGGRFSMKACADSRKSSVRCSFNPPV